MGGAGVSHFVAPQMYDPIIPKPLRGQARFLVYASGVVELACAGLLLSSRTRRAGGVLSFATILGVYPANIQAVLDGGMHHAKPPMNTRTAAIIRLPFQFPMLWEALRVARGAARSGDR
jgi:uncharacterized membrane protein